MSTNHNLFEEKGEPKRYRTEVLPLTNLTPYRLAKPAHCFALEIMALNIVCLDLVVLAVHCVAARSVKLLYFITFYSTCRCASNYDTDTIPYHYTRTQYAGIQHYHRLDFNTDLKGTIKVESFDKSTIMYAM